MKQHPEWVNFLREQYPPGTRVRLRQMNDPYHPVPPGTEGEIKFIDDDCNIHTVWDNGRALALRPDQDHFKVIEPESEQEMGGMKFE